ncbi:MAG: hypothetical protein EA425_17840 [Puniceicoccaceae bacterium]|nr:MAG: hypothetical protein EA425_17840 [Puniceicoccaceae bacterium]
MACSNLPFFPRVFIRLLPLVLLLWPSVSIGAVPLEEWLENMRVPADQRAPEDDPAQSGLFNLMSYALGLPPMESSQDRLPRPELRRMDEGTFLLLEVDLNPETTGIEVVVEGSTSLGGWSSDEKTVEILEETAEHLVVRHAVPVEKQGRQFLRIVVRQTGADPVVFTDIRLAESVRDALTEVYPELRDPDFPITPAMAAELEELSIPGGGLQDLAGIGQLTGLERLSIATQPGLTDLTPLADLGSLRELSLQNIAASDFSVLSTMTGLNDLSLRNLGNLSDLGPLAQLNLATLELNGSPVSELGPLAGMEALVRLTLSFTQVSDLAVIATLPNLENLNLQSTPVTDLGPLAGHPVLRVLNLRNTQVEDLGPLEGLAGLERLVLRGTPVNNLSVPAALPALDFLDVRETMVYNLLPLLGATATTYWLTLTPEADWCDAETRYVVDTLKDRGHTVHAEPCDGPYVLSGAITVKDGSPSPSFFEAIRLDFSGPEGEWSQNTFIGEDWFQEVEGEVTVVPSLAGGWRFEPASQTFAGPVLFVGFEIFQVEVIDGTLVDEDGQALPGITVRMEEVDTGEVFLTTTDSNGLFSIEFDERVVVEVTPQSPFYHFGSFYRESPWSFGEWVGTVSTTAPSGIAFVDDGALWRIDPDGSNRVKITDLGNTIFWSTLPTWSADGSQLLYADAPDFLDNDLWRINADGTGKTRLNEETDQQVMASTWRSDGSVLYAARRHDGAMPAGNPALLFLTTSAGGSGSPLLGTDASLSFDPAWSPDGSQIVFAGDPDFTSWGSQDPGIYIMDADGSNRSSRLSAGRRPAWSPDGTRIAYDDGGFIYVRTLATGATFPLVAGMGPTWSPDGEWIAYADDEVIYRIPAEQGGGPAVQITTGTQPAWAP